MLLNGNMNATQNAKEQQTRLAVAALGNEAASDANRTAQLEKLGGFARYLGLKISIDKN
jgi:hypothetical protein